MDNEHVLAFIEAVHGANRDAVRRFAADAAIVDDVGHLAILPARFQRSTHMRRPLVGWPKMDAPKIHVLWLNWNTQQ
jgi:hypothetical protein